MKKISLWQGHATVEFPEEPQFRDASDFRPIPDNQEMYVETARLRPYYGDRSMIFELLEQVEFIGQSAVEYLWKDLMETIRPESHTLLDMRQLTDGFSTETWRATGLMKMSSDATVCIILHLLRYPQFKTELLVAFHQPFASTVTDSQETIINNSLAMAGEIVRSFRFNDDGLFTS